MIINYLVVVNAQEKVLADRLVACCMTKKGAAWRVRMASQAVVHYLYICIQWDAISRVMSS